MKGMRRATRRRGRSTPQGFTLVEVLIAMVVLLIGVYAMFTIFPRGFLAMEATQARVTASQLAESELARWKLTPESIPDQIVATDYAGTLIPGTIAGTPTVSGNPGTAASMLLVWNPMAMPLPDSHDYHFATIDDKLFPNLDRVPGSLYLPGDTTSCQFDSVSGLFEQGGTIRGARLHPNWQPDSLYLPRTVIGERIDVKRLGSQSSGVPFYLLSHAPLDVLRYETTTSPLEPLKSVWLDIYDAEPWQYVPYGEAVEFGKTGPTLEQRQFTYKEDARLLYFGPMADGQAATGYDHKRAFKVDYTALFGAVNPVARQVYGLTVVTLDTGGVAAAPLQYAPAAVTSFHVYEKLEPLTEDEHTQAIQGLMPWPHNAYYINASTELTGKIEFCPDLQVDPKPGDLSFAKVDYRVRDWQILVFDVEVPKSGLVQLPVAHLKSSSYTKPPRQQRPQEVAKGARVIYGEDGSVDPAANVPANPQTWAYVVAVDRQNGDVLTDIDKKDLLLLTDQLPDNPYDRRTRVRVDYPNGILNFNYARKEVPQGTFNPNVDTPDRSGRSYRIFCRAEADWAVQLLPAARVYARSATTSPLGPAMGGEAGALLNYSWAPKRNPQQVFFPLSEIGQAVAVDYYKANGELVQGEIHSIIGPQVTDLGQWVGALSEPLKAAPNYLGPLTVRGLSVRARVMWVGKGRRPTLLDVATMVDNGGRARPQTSQEEAWYQSFMSTIIPRTPI